MEIKLRANIVMSKELTIEAENPLDAVNKAHAMMAEPGSMKGLTPIKMYFDELREGDKEFVIG
jgi:hypothetical protein